MVNYGESLIYKICCNDLNIKDIYVGSTTNFNRRKQQHKQNCNNINGSKYNYPIYKFIRDNGGFENWSMVLVEKVNVNDKQELHKKEREYIENLKATLNKIIPTRTQKQYNIDNKEKLKEYRLDNKEKIKENKKQYRLNNLEKIKEQQKQFRLDNKEKIKEFNKQYYINNAEKLNEKRKQKFKCDCGSNIRISEKSTHNRTKKHQKYLDSL